MIFVYYTVKFYRVVCFEAHVWSFHTVGPIVISYLEQNPLGHPNVKPLTLWHTGSNTMFSFNVWYIHLFLIFYLQCVYGVATAPSDIFKLICHNVFWTLKCLWAQSSQDFVSPSAWCKGFSSSFSPLKAALVFSRNIFLIIYTYEHYEQGAVN